MFLTLGSALIVLGVLIFVHELGHFWAAKAVGVGVPRFSMGLGPPTPLKWRQGETEYVVSWIPFGGYVKMATAELDDSMAGLEGASTDHSFPPDRLFENKPLWARIVVISAGVTMNILFAWLAYSALSFALGRTEDLATRIAAVDSTTLPPAARALARVPFGARIVRINGDTMESWNAVVDRILDPRADRLGFEFAGTEPVMVAIPGRDMNDRVALLNSLRRLVEPRVAYTYPGTAGAKAGIQAGDVIESINGAPIHNWDEMVKIIEAKPGDRVSLVLRRGDKTLAIRVVPDSLKADDPSGQSRWVGKIGLARTETRYISYGLGGALAVGAVRTLDDVGKVWFVLKGMVLRRLPLRDLGGPIMIGQLSGQMARAGLDQLVALMAFLSVNLAVLNLLPVPVLDGGHLAFLLAEGVRGRPLSLRMRLRLSQVGLALLLALMVFATRNDLLRWIRG